MPLARGAPCKDDAAHCLPSFYRDGSITELPCQTGTQAGITGPDVPAGAFYERGIVYDRVFKVFHAHVR